MISLQIVYAELTYQLFLTDYKVYVTIIRTYS